MLSMKRWVILFEDVLRIKTFALYVEGGITQCSSNKQSVLMCVLLYF